MAAVSDWASAVKAAFDAMKVTGPRPLLRRIAMDAEETGLKGEPGEQLAACLTVKASPIREELQNRLSEWDYQGNAVWTKTAPNTPERRDAILELLALPGPLRKAINIHLPPRTADVDRELVIDAHGTTDWYTPAFLRDREFYWPRYREYLKTKKGMSEDTLISLHESASRVVERLAPPHSAKPDPRRGLVIGYVQSGKTTNFTAVIAKAIDAGYRLIIVLAGTIDLLRLQTQRRLDMELVGVENIGVDVVDGDSSADDEPEYNSDAAFPAKFISYGKKPRHFKAPNIKRLTSSNGDFRSIDASFQALAFDELGGTEKAYALDSIKRTNVRLIVIKKVTARLKKLVKEIHGNRDIREQLPTLIIDDESDQASVNTNNPDKATAIERSKTNGRIVELLGLLPRAQYVGYTATPFANVLVDPSDAADIYPRDFIVSLPRPEGYMGVRDFHDIDSTDGETPNKAAFVRQFERDDLESINRALDAFVVSGALKLFRKARGAAGDFRHHTMMVHESVKNDDQFGRRDEIVQLWKAAGYGSTGAGPKRLRDALENDFRAVWKARASKLPFPDSYTELKPYVGEALKLIGTESPVIVVNGDEGGEDPAFDTTDHVWKIVVGGAKLSRGFTVEGLTITFFRRRAKQQDSMMQMGRWFGYRAGYPDLVRLFIERGDDSAYDLYEAFESSCRDEEMFRAQLSQYAKKNADGSHMRPIDVPAVVYNSFPGVMPTAKNKMFNARLVSAAVSDEWRQPTSVSMKKTDVASNWGALKTLVAPGLRQETLGGREFLVRGVPREEVLTFMAALKWANGLSLLAAERHFFATSEHAVKKWLVALPLLQSRALKVGGELGSVFERTLKDDVFNIFTAPADRAAVKAAVTATKGNFAGRAVLLVYPTHIKPKHTLEFPFLGLGVYHPAVPGDATRTVFTVRDPKHKDSVVISAK